MNQKGNFLLVVVAIVLVAFVAASALVWMFMSPSPKDSGLGVFSGSNEARVIALGVLSEGVMTTLSSGEAQTMGIAYPINFNPSYVTSDLLSSYNVVILQGDPYFDLNTREIIKQYVDSGGKLIVVGDAASKHPEYANVAGWNWPSGDGIPVPAQIIGEWAGYSDVSYGSELMWADPDHPIVKGLKLTGAQLATPTQVIKVTARGRVIAAISTTEGTVPAIIEGGSGFGNVIYFSYDPGQTPEILLLTVKYLAGV